MHRTSYSFPPRLNARNCPPAVAFVTAAFASLPLWLPVAVAQNPPAPAPAAAQVELPVREVTVFKDGHAFVMHQGAVPADAHGNVVLDRLPTPVLGTFWAYSATPAAKLAGVIAGRRSVNIERTALGLQELLRSNAGAAVFVTEQNG